MGDHSSHSGDFFQTRSNRRNIGTFPAYRNPKVQHHMNRNGTNHAAHCRPYDALAPSALLLLPSVPSLVAQTNVPPPVPHWDTSVAVGVTATSGNSDSILATVTGRADKKWDPHELHFGVDFAYGKADGLKNNDSVRAFGQYNYLFTDRWYGYVRAEGLH